MKYNPLLGSVEECIERNKRIVYKFANRYAAVGKQYGLEYEDLVQEGYIGLLRAYQCYDGRAQWSTFAFLCVQAAIQKAVYLSDAGATYSRYVKERAIVARRRGLSEACEIQEQLGFTREMASYVTEYLLHSKPLYLDEVRYDSQDDDEPMMWMDVIRVYDDDTEMDVSRFLASLSERDRLVLEMWTQGYLQREIAEVLGVSQVQVSRIEARIRAKAGAYFAA